MRRGQRRKEQKKPALTVQLRRLNTTGVEKHHSFPEKKEEVFLSRDGAHSHDVLVQRVRFTVTTLGGFRERHCYEAARHREAKEAVLLRQNAEQEQGHKSEPKHSALQTQK